MDENVACIICNWLNALTLPYIGAAALGAAVAGALGIDDFVRQGISTSRYRAAQEDARRQRQEQERQQQEQERLDRADDVGEDSRSDPGPPEHNHPPVPPIGWPESPRYVDSSGKPYWPGLADIPTDGVVYLRGIPSFPYPVDRDSGTPIQPITKTAEVAAAHVLAGRG